MKDKTSKSYHKLILWQKLKDLLLITYSLTDKLPKSEDFVLKPQMNRAVISIISNFVEGYMKASKKEKIHFMEIAQTSLMELEGQGEVCLLLSYWSDQEYEEFDQKRSSVGYFLYRYRSSIK